MGEIKSVKVDNWGVFFLQKLQNFFNKTDYCDLTLQFNDNSQLKVHRLVLSACTDYFNVLEQTCEMVDDALIMPNELQADVVVPIVNFMYTGTLEFELKMYGKLLRTAKEMNMTVLLKLLEAHRRTMEGVNRSQGPASPKSIRKRGTVPTIPTATQMRPFSNTSPQQHRRILSNSTAQRRPVQMKTISTNVPQAQVVQYRQALGTSLLTTSTSASVSFHKNQHTTYEATSNTGDAGAYEPTMQFKEEQHDDYETQLNVNNQSTSPFEQLRKGYNNNKRPASATFISPPAKKPNIEDVKEFAEQQRMRKQIAAEYGEDQEYESTMLDDDIHNDDDDDDTAAPISSSSLPTLSPSTTAIRQQQHLSGPSIIIKQEPNEKPTIVVKDSSNSKVNHAKIISEVLRQYPHLVKSNKNIKLKIMPNVGGQSQKIIVKKEQFDNISADLKIETVSPTTCTSQTLLKSAKTHEKSDQAQMQRAQKQASVAQTVVSAGSASQNTPPSGVSTQKRRIDSKTMHALIALGAENTSGPWLCLRCGVNGRPISIPSYRGFRRHLINTHKETIDTSLCEHCGWRSTSNRELHFHIQIEHKINSSVYMFSECLSCSEFFIDSCALSLHKIDSHPEENQQQCIYCNKIFAKELELYTHMKTYHKKQAIDDGIIDYSDADDEDEPMDTQETPVKDSVDEKPDSPSSSACNKNKKIKILSDISIPSASTLMKLEPSTSTANFDKIASSIATSAAGETVSEPKFVTVDGNEMMLTDEQRKEIMSQLNQEHEGGVVMVLNESVFAGSVAASTETNEEASTDDSPQSAEPTANLDHEAEEQPTTGASINEDEEYDDSNIYDEFVSKVEIENKKEVASLDESKGSTDNLEWAENLLTAHELEDEDTSKTEPKQVEDNDRNANDRKINEDISQKLKELTGDWSDDEIEDDDEEEDEVNAKLLHTELELKEEHREDTGESSIVQDAKELQKAPEVEECLNVKTEKPDNLSEDDEKIESTETKDDREHQRVDDREDGPEDVCEDEREGDREDYIDSALEGLHKEVEIEAGNDETHVAGATASNGKESEDTLASQEVPNKDHSLGLISDVSSTLTEEIAVATKHCEKILFENEKDEIETELPEDKEELSKVVLSEENNVKPSIKESNLRVDAEIRNTAELEAIKGEEKKDGVTEIKIEEPAIPPTEFVTPTSKTEEKIKTLISEWGDDDDEVEDLGTLE